VMWAAKYKSAGERGRLITTDADTGTD